MATFIAVSLPFFALHLFNHPFADDFVYALSTREHGWPGAQTDWYARWNGRYTSTALLTASPLAAGWLPGYKLASLFAMLLLLGAVLHACRAGLLAAGLERGWLAVALGFFAVALCQMPSTAEGLYWMPGWVNYTLPTAGLLVAGGVYLRMVETPNGRGRRLALLVGLCALVIGGNETLLALVCLAAGLLTLQALRRRRDLLAAHAVLLVACLASAALVALSPGNALRGAHRPPVAAAVAASLSQAAERALEWTGLPLVLAAIVVALAAARSPLPARTGLTAPAAVVAALAAWLLVPLVGQLPAQLALGTRPPARAENSLALLFQAAGLVLAAQLGLRARPRLLRLERRWPRLPAVAALGLLAAAVLSQASLWAWRDLFLRAPAYDRDMRARYERLAREHGDLVLPYASWRTRPRSLFVGDVGPDPGSWVNRHTARYFGVASLRMAPAPTGGDVGRSGGTPPVY